MPSLKTLLSSSILALLASAAPHPDPSLSGNVTVFIRHSDNAYHPSHDMANTINARNAALPLAKCSSGMVEACYTAECTQCYVLFANSLTTNTSCNVAINTACLIVSDMNNAKVVFWNKAGCNGRSTTYGGVRRLIMLLGRWGPTRLACILGARSMSRCS